MRIIGLDILRAIAILLVLIRHSALENALLHKFGWLGVDLFFIISGFLVSGLLFSEYKKKGKFNIKRFLIRRGFKIYPSFYLLLLVSIVLNSQFAQIFPTTLQAFSEIFYFQNYGDPILTHSWSLAVEEHFYLLLAFTLFILGKGMWFKPNTKSVWYLFLLLLSAWGIRFFVCYTHREFEHFSIIKTHLRADGIVIGIIISYIFHFTNYLSKMLRFKWVLIALSVLLLAPAFIWDAGTFWMNVIGLALVNLGFGIIVLLVVANPTHHQQKKIWVQKLAFIGTHSYSIYLWQFVPYFFLMKLFDYNTYIMSSIFIASALFVGIVFSITVERVFLKMRENNWVKKWY